MSNSIISIIKSMKKTGKSDSDIVKALHKLFGPCAYTIGELESMV